MTKKHPVVEISFWLHLQVMRELKLMYLNNDFSCDAFDSGPTKFEDVRTHALQ